MARNTKSLCVFAALAFLAACGRSEKNAHDDAPPSTAAHYPAADIPSLMAAADVPGLAIAKVNDCAAGEASFYGVADIETGDPVNAETVFEAASLTKPVFSLIVNQLADEGVIDLDASLAAHFDYPRVSDREGYAKLTPRMILAHRSGFPNWASDPTDKETWGDIAFKNPPGEAFGYSGEAYQLLQAYVEDRTGKTLDMLFEERLGARMPDTSLSAPRADVELAYGHDKEGGKNEGRALIAPERAGAAFSANSNAGDYARFLEYVCEGGDLSESAINEMLRPQSPTADDAISWALGWGVQVSTSTPIYFHWGDNGPFKSFAAFNPASRDGVVYFANGHNGLQLIEALSAPVVGDITPIADWLDYGRVDLAVDE